MLCQLLHAYTVISTLGMAQRMSMPSQLTRVNKPSHTKKYNIFVEKNSINICAIDSQLQSNEFQPPSMTLPFCLEAQMSSNQFNVPLHASISKYWQGTLHAPRGHQLYCNKSSALSTLSTVIGAITSIEKSLIISNSMLQWIYSRKNLKIFILLLEHRPNHFSCVGQYFRHICIY